MTEDPAEYGFEPEGTAGEGASEKNFSQVRGEGKNTVPRSGTNKHIFDFRSLHEDLGEAASLLEVWRARVRCCLQEEENIRHGQEACPHTKLWSVTDLLLRAEFILQSQIQLARLADGGRTLSASVLLGLGAVLEEADTLVLQALEVCADLKRGREIPTAPGE